MFISLQSLGHFPEREGEKAESGNEVPEKFVDVIVDVLSHHFATFCYG